MLTGILFAIGDVCLNMTVAAHCLWLCIDLYQGVIANWWL